MKSTRQQSMWIELEEQSQMRNEKKNAHPFPNLGFLFLVMERTERVNEKETKSTGWQETREKKTFCYKFFGLAAATVTIHFQHHNLSFDWKERMDLMKSFSLTLMFTLTTSAIYAIFTVHYRHTHAFTRRSTLPPCLSRSRSLPWLCLRIQPLSQSNFTRFTFNYFRWNF